MDKYRKSFLRGIYLKARQNLTPDAVEGFNRLLLLRVRVVDWSSYSLIHSFLPILSQNEPDTLRIISWLRTRYPKIQVAVPRVSSGPDNVLTHHILDECTVLKQNKWGIPEPENAVSIMPQSVDVVLVPTLVFDREGHRIGYGRGFYDRFLSECRADVLKVGLSFFDPVPRIADVQETDVPLDCCLTPHRAYWFGKK